MTFLLNASLTCQYRVKVMVILPSVGLFVFEAEGIRGKGCGMVTLCVCVCVVIENSVC